MNTPGSPTAPASYLGIKNAHAHLYTLLYFSLVYTARPISVTATTVNECGASSKGVGWNYRITSHDGLRSLSFSVLHPRMHPRNPHFPTISNAYLCWMFDVRTDLSFHVLHERKKISGTIFQTMFHI